MAELPLETEESASDLPEGLIPPEFKNDGDTEPVETPQVQVAPAPLGDGPMTKCVARLAEPLSKLFMLFTFAWWILGNVEVWATEPYDDAFAALVAAGNYTDVDGCDPGLWEGARIWLIITYALCGFGCCCGICGGICLAGVLLKGPPPAPPS